MGAGWDVKTVAAHLVSDFANGIWGFRSAGFATAASFGGLMRWGVNAHKPRPVRSPTHFIDVQITSSVHQ